MARGTGRRGGLLEYVVMAVTGILALVFTLAVPGFATLGNLSVAATNSAALVILACGMGVVVISRGLDLSLVAAMVAGAATFGILIDVGLPGHAALGLAAFAMVLVGLLNGWLIAYAEIPAMLATLATAMVITGVFRFGLMQGEFLLLLPAQDPAVRLLSADLFPGLRVPVVLAGLVVLVSWGILNFSTPGRVTYAMGDNFAAARLSGLPVRTTTLLIHVFAALTALVAGLISAAASGTVDFRTVTGGSLLFEVILVVVLGGIPLRGGRGGVRNILVGLALVAVLRNGMTLMNLSTQTQDMLKGLVLILAIVTDNYLNPRDTETDTTGDL